MDERDTQQIINVQNLFIFVKKNFYLFMWMKIKITTNLRTKIFYADTLYIILVPQERMWKSQKRSHNYTFLQIIHSKKIIHLINIYSTYTNKTTYTTQ